MKAGLVAAGSPSRPSPGRRAAPWRRAVAPRRRRGGRRAGHVRAAAARGTRADACVIPEPTDLDVVPANGGALTFRLRRAGSVARTPSRRTEGVSAVDKLRPVLAALRGLEASPQHRRGPADGALAVAYPISVGTVRAGDWASTVPDLLVADGSPTASRSTRPGRGPGRALEAAGGATCATDPWLSDHPVAGRVVGRAVRPRADRPAAPADRAVRDAHAAAAGGARAPDVYGAPYGSRPAAAAPGSAGSRRCSTAPVDTRARTPPTNWWRLDQVAAQPAPWPWWPWRSAGLVSGRADPRLPHPACGRGRALPRPAGGTLGRVGDRSRPWRAQSCAATAPCVARRSTSSSATTRASGVLLAASAPTRPGPARLDGPRTRDQALRTPLDAGPGHRPSGCWPARRWPAPWTTPATGPDARCADRPGAGPARSRPGLLVPGPGGSRCRLAPPDPRGGAAARPTPAAAAPRARLAAAGVGRSCRPGATARADNAPGGRNPTGGPATGRRCPGRDPRAGSVGPRRHLAGRERLDLAVLATRPTRTTRRSRRGSGPRRCRTCRGRSAGRSGPVGPLVLPGSTGCLRCLDLHRCDRDPDWPLVAAQLDHRRPPYPRAARWPSSPRLALAAAVAAHAGRLAHAGARIDGPRDPVRRWRRHAELASAHATPSGAPANAHPLCGCRWADARATMDRGDRPPAPRR